MRIAILGAGGVGGYFGGRFAAAGADIHFIARGEHLSALRAHGLRIESPLGNLHLPAVNATDDPAAVGPVDLVLFTVKLYDVESAVAQLKPLVGPQTIIVPLQNGVDTFDVLTRAVGKQHVVGGTTYVSAVIAEPGLIRHTAMDTLVFGPVSGPAPAQLVELQALCTTAGCKGVLSDHIMVDIWTKFARLSVFSGITSVTRSPIGPVRQDPDLRALVEAALHESIMVGRARQIPLSHNIFPEAMRGFDAMPPQARSSMLEDLERGRRIELPWLSGAVARIGRETGVKTPTHDMFDMLLRLHVNGKQT
jgi:2-dehydropantoate 2-reductase